MCWVLQLNLKAQLKSLSMAKPQTISRCRDVHNWAHESLAMALLSGLSSVLACGSESGPLSIGGVFLQCEASINSIMGWYFDSSVLLRDSPVKFGFVTHKFRTGLQCRRQQAPGLPSLTQLAWDTRISNFSPAHTAHIVFLMHLIYYGEVHQVVSLGHWHR